MPFEVVNTYQATFNHISVDGNDAQDTSVNDGFHFTRYMKTDERNCFQIRVQGISQYVKTKDQHQPHLFYMKNCPELTGKCNTNGEPKWFLGVLGNEGDKGSTSDYGNSTNLTPSYLLVDDIPLSPFTMDVKNIVETVAMPPLHFSVSFLIEEIKKYKY